jgi:hypothetical protein
VETATGSSFHGSACVLQIQRGGSAAPFSAKHGDDASATNAAVKRKKTRADFFTAKFP